MMRCLDMHMTFCPFCILYVLLVLQEVVRQAEALYDTLMKAKSGPSQPSKPASANWASTGWKRGADAGSTGNGSSRGVIVHIAHLLRVLLFQAVIRSGSARMIAGRASMPKVRTKRTRPPLRANAIAVESAATSRASALRHRDRRRLD